MMCINNHKPITTMTYIFRILAMTILAIALNACGPPEPPPAPYFIPNPPYPPQPVDPATAHEPQAPSIDGGISPSLAPSSRSLTTPSMSAASAPVSSRAIHRTRKSFACREGRVIGDW
jgi:hypothetical protein